jgi:uncharacterized DUF497 family protein
MPGFDPEKRSRTIEDRGLDFIDAVALFDGRPMLTVPSDRNDEARYKSIAMGDDGKFLLRHLDMASIRSVDYLVSESAQ